MCGCDVAYTCPRCAGELERAEAVEVDETERDRNNTSTDPTRETE